MLARRATYRPTGLPGLGYVSWLNPISLPPAPLFKLTPEGTIVQAWPSGDVIILLK